MIRWPHDSPPWTRAGFRLLSRNSGHLGNVRAPRFSDERPRHLDFEGEPLDGTTWSDTDADELRIVRLVSDIAT